jgi:hypothetical protein
MPKLTDEDYLAVPQYEEALAALHGITAILLFEFARDERDVREVIIRNFLARTDMLSKSIFSLWNTGDHHDCWVLHRCLLDRLFHLHHLNAANEFEAFERWSFWEQYNALNRVRSNLTLKEALKSDMFALTDSQKERAKALSTSKPTWVRPKAEVVAAQMHLEILYLYGYDFASTHVHPMANDGYEDFFTITKLEPRPVFPDQRSVLSNTLLVATIVVQEGLNASHMSWRAIVYDFLDQLRTFLDNGTTEYRATFVKLGKMFRQNIALCGTSTRASGNENAG